MINNDINNSTIEPGFIAFSTTELFTALGQAHENWNSFSEFKQSVRRSIYFLCLICTNHPFSLKSTGP